MLALLGLKDSYVTDGRVLTEILKGDALPKSLEKNKATVEKLGASYKQIMASFGQFSMDTLTPRPGRSPATAPVTPPTPRPKLHSRPLAQHRDAAGRPDAPRAVARRVRRQAIDKKAADGWIKQAKSLLDQAAALAGSFHSPAADQKTLDKIKHIVVIYEENHSFDNLYGGWEGVNGPPMPTLRTPPRSTRPGTPTHA